MNRMLNDLGNYRDRSMLAFVGGFGFAVTLAVIEIAVAYSLPPHSVTIIVPAAGGGLLSMCLFGWADARRMAKLLSKHNDQFGIALDNMIQGLCMFDGQNRLVVWNERYRAMYNIDPEHIWAGCGISDLLEARKAAGNFPYVPAKYEADLRAAIDQGDTFTHNMELDDGRTIAIVNTPMEDGGWVATHDDITERKRGERELEQTRGFLDTILENVPSPIIVKDSPDLCYRLINRAAEKLLGGAIDQPVAQIRNVLDDDRRRHVLENRIEEAARLLQFALGAFALGDVVVGRHPAAIFHRRVDDGDGAPVVQFHIVRECVALIDRRAQVGFAFCRDIRAVARRLARLKQIADAAAGPDTLRIDIV